MRIPITGERVRVVGEDGEFLVLTVDHTHHVADLMHMAGTRRVEYGISLRAIRPVEDRPGARSESLDQRSTELQSQ